MINPRAGRRDEARRVSAPTGLDDAVVALADTQAGATHGGHERTGGRPICRPVAHRQRLVAVIARREVDTDALDGTLEQRVLLGLDEPEGQQLSREAVRVGHDRGEMPIDDMVHRRVEVLVVVGRPHVDDVRVGRHAVHGLDVERLLAVPALRILPLVFRPVHRARRHHLGDVGRRHPAVGGPLVQVLLDGGRCVGVDDRDRLAVALKAGRHAVDAPNLARHVSAGRHRQRQRVARRCLKRRPSCNSWTACSERVSSCRRG